MTVKHGKCGGKHETMAEVYACEGGRPEPTWVEPRLMDQGQSGYAHTHRRPTAPMLALIERLLPEPAIPQELRAKAQDYLDSKKFTWDTARAAIDRLKSTIAVERVDEAGYYKNPDGVIWRVVEARHGAGRLYASYCDILTEVERDADGNTIKPAQFSWVYMPGAITALLKSWVMQPEDFKQFGDLYGCCLKCHAILTRPESIARGMGPTCAAK